jgi:hypothetical protein
MHVPSKNSKPRRLSLNLNAAESVEKSQIGSLDTTMGVFGEIA